MRVSDDIVIPESEIEETFSRSGGPGGQHANKVETEVRIRFDVRASTVLSQEQKDRVLANLSGRLSPDGVLELVCSRYRSQWRNRVEARRRLFAVLRTALVPRKRRKATKPTNASRKARVESKRRRGEAKRLRRPPDPE